MSVEPDRSRPHTWPSVVEQAREYLSRIDDPANPRDHSSWARYLAAGILGMDRALEGILKDAP